MSRPLSTPWTSAISPTGVRLLAAEPATLDAIPVFDPAAFPSPAVAGAGAAGRQGARRHCAQWVAGRAALSTSMAVVVVVGLVLGAGGPRGPADPRPAASPVAVGAPSLSPSTVAAAGAVGSRLGAVAGRADDAPVPSGAVDDVVDRPDEDLRAVAEILGRRAATKAGARLGTSARRGR